MPVMRREVVLGASIWLYWFSLYAYVPILPTYAKDLGAGYEMIGIILGSYGFTQMALRLPLGIVSDRLNKRRVFLLAGAALCIVSGLGMWLLRDVTALFIFRMLSGVAATVWVIQSILFAGYYPPGESARAMGLVTAVVNCGEMVAMLIGGVVAEYCGQEQSFLLAAVVGVAALACSLAIHEPAGLKPGEPFRLAEAAAMARDRGLGLASVLGFIVQVISYATAYGFVPLVAKNLGASYTQIGLLPTVYMLPGIFASMLSGTVLLRLFGERLLAAVSLLAMSVSSVAIPFIGSLAALFVLQIIGGFGRGLVFPLLMGLSIRGITGSRRATAMGFFQAAYGLG
ncbi:MAG TPA: MFS transporter, partial [Negativicutes bacterium]|nr:MFS transporter [Negativicutes bacterium]